MNNNKLQPYADLKYKTREYTDKDGKTKGVWVKVGTLFSSPHGSHMSIKIDTMPVGEWNGWLSVYKHEDKSGQPMAQIQALNGGKDFAPRDIDDGEVDLSTIPF